jgi:SAM-dependent methyltransferase
MSQITSGMRSVLSSPAIYDRFQNLMGASKRRAELSEHFIRPFSGMKILDIGCGTARILDFLPHTIEYHGFDLSQEYINQAISNYANRGVFKCELVEESTFQGSQDFDLVLAVGVLHHLDDKSSLNLFQLANSVLKIGGRLVTLDPCFDDSQNPIARFLVSRDRGQNVRTGEQYFKLSSRVFKKIDGSIKHRKWIPYTHWVMECTK